MSTTRLLGTAAVAMTAAASASPVIDIPPGGLPGEAYFLDHPTAVVNVFDEGAILPGEFADPFSFGGATVNILSGGAQGWFTLDHFVENGTFNLDGGEIMRGTFTGTVGTTTLNITSGSAERGLKIQGNTVANISGGFVGLVAQGAPSIILSGASEVNMSGGEIDDVISVEETSTFNLTGGTIGTHVNVVDDATMNMSGGSIGRWGRVSGIGATMNLSGGTTGRDLVVERGTLNISGGGLGENAGMVTAVAPDPVVNVTGGAIGSGFRAYDGVMTVSGGLIGDSFRLGTPSGDGSGATLRLLVKSVSLDTVPLELTANVETLVTVRDGVFLSAVLLDDSLIGLHLNEAAVSGEDRIRAGATLTVTWVVDCDADLVAPFGTLDLADISAFTAGFLAGDPLADLNGDGVYDLSDVGLFIDSFNAGCS